MRARYNVVLELDTNSDGLLLVLSVKGLGKLVNSFPPAKTKALAPRAPTARWRDSQEKGR